MDEIATCGHCKERFCPRTNTHKIKKTPKSTRLAYKCPSCGSILIPPKAGWKTQLKWWLLLAVFLFLALPADLIWTYFIGRSLLAAIIASLAYAAPLFWMFIKLLTYMAPIELKEPIYTPLEKLDNKG